MSDSATAVGGQVETIPEPKVADAFATQLATFTLRLMCRGERAWDPDLGVCVEDMSLTGALDDQAGMVAASDGSWPDDLGWGGVSLQGPKPWLPPSVVVRQPDGDRPPPV